MQSSHFKPTVLGNVLRFFNGKSIKPGGDGVYPVYGSNGLIGQSSEYTHQNGLIIGRVGAYCGSIKYCKTHFWASDNTIVGQPKDISFDIEYIYYLLGGLNLNRYAGGSAQPLLTQIVLRQVPTSIPPIPTQRQIANFLDHKTGQIDDLIRVKERKIELLGEYRASLIHQAVTKGLDPNVEMKPSGVDWIGEIPKYWQVKKLKYFCSLKSGNGFSHDLQGRTSLEVPFFKVSDTNLPTNKVEMLCAQNTVSSHEVHAFKFTLHKPKSIVFPKIGAALLLNKRNILVKDSCIDNNMMSVYSTQLNYKLLYYTMINVDFERYYRGGGTVPSINESEVGDIQIAYPTLSEQFQIAAFLDHKTRQIDEHRSTEEQSIKLLKEYRQSLISEVVTGKIDVRDEV